MGVEKQLKEYTKIALTVALEGGTGGETGKEKGTITCYFFRVCMVEFFTACMHECKKEVRGLTLYSISQLRNQRYRLDFFPFTPYTRYAQ